MEEWAQRAEGSGGVGNLARKVVKPASAGRKLTIKPFKGASARASVVVPVGQIARRARRARLSLPPSRRHRPAVGLPLPPHRRSPAPAAAAEKPKLPADFEAKAWDALSGAIDAIHAKARPRSIITHIYTGPHTTAFARWTPILKDFCRRLSPPIPRFQSPPSTPFNFIP